MSDTIVPKVLKGFRDSLPQAEIKRRILMEKVEGVFRRHGFAPIDTPALEYAEILLGKGGGETEKQVYRFRDHGDRDVALRFDLTVPFARFMAEHHGELALPFKRYHIAKVWRGENTQRGRYREFYQCDFDCVGADSAAADFEILHLMRASLQALDLGSFTIRLSHRAVFNRLLSRLGASASSVEVLRLVDKLAKIGRESVEAQLVQMVGSDAASAILRFITATGGFMEVLSTMEELAGGPAEDTARLRDIHALMEGTGVDSSFVLDPSITRGLDYYTGVVFETFLDAQADIGSVCSGGRYDDLASLYSKERMPGVGASIGMDRLLAALDNAKEAKAPSTFALLAVLPLSPAQTACAFRTADALRGAGIACEVCTDGRKLSQEFAYAERKGMNWALLLGEEEASSGTVTLRDLSKRENVSRISVAEAIAVIRGASR